MKSGDKILTLAGTMATVPFANEHPCFGQRQGWCTNLASWRLEGPRLILHFCSDCKKRPQTKLLAKKKLFPNVWTKLDERGHSLSA